MKEKNLPFYWLEPAAKERAIDDFASRHGKHSDNYILAHMVAFDYRFYSDGSLCRQTGDDVAKATIKLPEELKKQLNAKVNIQALANALYVRGICYANKYTFAVDPIGYLN